MISLRNRLLASYLFLLVFTLGGIVIALFVATSNEPAPPQPTYQRLEVIQSGLDSPTLLGHFGGPPIAPLAGSQQETRLEAMRDYAETHSIRVMMIRMAQRPGRLEEVDVAFDSDGTFTENIRIEVRLDEYESIRPYRPMPPAFQFHFGRFYDNGEEWLFSGVSNPDGPGRRAIIVAERRPTQSLQSVLVEFGASLVPPLIQAGLIGLLIAIGLSALISRTIAQPLQAAATAATAVAEGDLNQHVPVTGPREVRAVAIAFNRMSAQVRATQQAQRDFMANVSHDLKTPLTSIQGYSQAIIDGATKDPAQAAEIIHDEAGRMNRMVVELTDLARLQAGQFSMKTAEVDMGQIATQVTRKLAVVAEKKGVTLASRTPSMPSVTADGDRMVQVLTNLLSNAIQYTPKGGTVRVETRSRHGGVEIIVWDTGIGIPQKDLPRIFERFYQVDKARGPARGTGLGLAITHEIVQAHGGTIEVESTEGRGTTFTVWLPYSKMEAPGIRQIPEGAAV